MAVPVQDRRSQCVSSTASAVTDVRAGHRLYPAGWDLPDEGVCAYDEANYWAVHSGVNAVRRTLASVKCYPLTID